MPGINDKEQHLRDQFARMMGKLLQYAAKQNIDVLVFSLTRTAQTQRKFYDEGKSKLDGVLKKSTHQRGRAFDLVVIKGKKTIWKHVEEYTTLGEYWEKLGGVWGGRWKDPHDIYHFQL